MAVYLGSNQVDLLGGDGIPSAYLIPSGTYSISQNGIYDVGSYKSASVDLPYYGIYKAIANREVVYASGSSTYGYTSDDIVNWCNSYSVLRNNHFAGALFEGSFTFTNVVSLEYGGEFGSIFVGAEQNFLSLTGFKCNLPQIKSIFSGTFMNNFQLKEIIASSCTYIHPEAFRSCHKLNSVSIPNCSYIGDNAFQWCSRLTSINFPNCSIISFNAFQWCSRLTSINFPNCTSIGPSAFGSCDSLTTINFPKCNDIGSYAFQWCPNLTTISFPECITVYYNAFYKCFNLTTVSFPKCTSIGGYAFQSCYNLLSVYLLGSSVVSISGTTIFNSTPISTYTTSTGGVYGSIFVPASLYNSYITASYWSIYSSRIVSLTDEQITALG